MLTESFNIASTVDLVENEKKYQLRLALNSLEKQNRYCSIHYDEFNKAVIHNRKATVNGLRDESLLHRDYFEAHSIAFLRTLHSLIDSVPYIVNILIGDKKTEDPSVNWKHTKECLISAGYDSLEKDVCKFRKTEEYKQLSQIVNMLKHRRVPSMELCIFSQDKTPRFVRAEFKYELYELSISKFIEDSHKIIQPFMVMFLKKLIVSITPLDN